MESRRHQSTSAPAPPSGVVRTHVDRPSIGRTSTLEREGIKVWVGVNIGELKFVVGTVVCACASSKQAASCKLEQTATGTKNRRHMKIFVVIVQLLFCPCFVLGPSPTLATTQPDKTVLGPRMIILWVPFRPKVRGFRPHRTSAGADGTE